MAVAPQWTPVQNPSFRDSSTAMGAASGAFDRVGKVASDYLDRKMKEEQLAQAQVNADRAFKAQQANTDRTYALAKAQADEKNRIQKETEQAYVNQYRDKIMSLTGGVYDNVPANIMEAYDAQVKSPEQKNLISQYEAGRAKYNQVVPTGLTGPEAKLKLDEINRLDKAITDMNVAGAKQATKSGTAGSLKDIKPLTGTDIKLTPDEADVVQRVASEYPGLNPNVVKSLVSKAKEDKSTFGGLFGKDMKLNRDMLKAATDSFVQGAAGTTTGTTNAAGPIDAISTLRKAYFGNTLDPLLNPAIKDTKVTPKEEKQIVAETNKNESEAGKEILKKVNDNLPKNTKIINSTPKIVTTNEGNVEVFSAIKDNKITLVNAKGEEVDIIKPSESGSWFDNILPNSPLRRLFQ